MTDEAKTATANNPGIAQGAGQSADAETIPAGVENTAGEAAAVVERQASTGSETPVEELELSPVQTQDAVKVAGEASLSGIDTSMDAKAHGFPHVRVHGDRIGQLWYLDAVRADVVFPEGDQATVRPQDLEVMRPGNGELDAVPPKSK